MSRKKMNMKSNQGCDKPINLSALPEKSGPTPQKLTIYLAGNEGLSAQRISEYWDEFPQEELMVWAHNRNAILVLSAFPSIYKILASISDEVN